MSDIVLNNKQILLVLELSKQSQVSEKYAKVSTRDTVRVFGTPYLSLRLLENLQSVGFEFVYRDFRHILLKRI